MAESHRASFRASMSLGSMEDLDDTELLKLDPVHEAALFIQDALNYSTHSQPRKGPFFRRLHHISLRMQPYVYTCLVLLLSLGFFELPSWCARNHDGRASLHGGHLTGSWYSGAGFFYWDRKDAPHVVYPLFGLPIAPLWASSAIEVTLHLFLAFELLCDMFAQGVRRFLLCSPRRQVVYSIVLFLALVDGVVRVFLPWPAGYAAPYLRVVLLCAYSPGILSELRLVFNTMKSFFGIIIVLAAFLLFTSWVGIILFASNNPEHQGGKYFTSWWATAWQLFSATHFLRLPTLDRSLLRHTRIATTLASNA